MSLRGRALAASAALLGALLGCGPTLPEPLAPEAARTERGKITVIEFIDFQCPFCRKNHELLAPLVRSRASRVRLVRKQVPLRKHAHARSAALAALCAEAQGKGDEMADGLAASEVRDLRSEGCEELALTLRLDVERFRACVSDPKTSARLDEEDALFDAVGGRGLPLLFIGPQRFVGLQNEATLERALDEEIAKLTP